MNQLILFYVPGQVEDFDLSLPIDGDPNLRMIFNSWSKMTVFKGLVDPKVIELKNVKLMLLQSQGSSKSHF